MDMISSPEKFEIFPWNVHFEVGIACLDDQHKKLMDLINDAAWSLITETDASNQQLALDNLLDYARFHFHCEEQIWSRYLSESSLYANHQKLHNDFFLQIDKFIFADGQRRYDIEGLFEFLTNWLIVHILQSDRYFATAILEIENFGYSLPDAQSNAKKKILASSEVQTTLVQLYNKLCSSALQLNREAHARLVAEEKVNNLIKAQAEKELERQALEYQGQLEFLAYNDPLTGALNRNGVLQALLTYLGQQTDHDNVAVISIDLDDFAKNNTQVGVEGGDRILGMLVRRWQDAIMPGGHLARIGGDEFVVLVRDTDHVTSQLSALRLCLKREFVIDHWRVLLDFTAGIYAKGLEDEEHEQDAEGCLRCADYALYLAKRENKGAERYFDSSEEQKRQIRIRQIKRVKAALDGDELQLFYQPKVNMRTGKVVGVEALLRWHHPTAGLRAPGQFLPYLENHPFMIDIGEWAIRTALKQLVLWDSLGIHLRVSVNIDTIQLQHPEFPKKLRKLLAAYPNVDASRLELEVLESVAIQDIDVAVHNLEKCKALGVTFSLDDFGKGYCSLSYLRQLPVDTIKIDQAFVIEMFRYPKNLSILEGMVALARTFDLKIIAEGVETVAHGKYLVNLGCELAQGYEIAKPMPGENLPNWIEAWKPDVLWSNSVFLRREDIPALIALVEIEHRIKINNDAEAGPMNGDHTFASKKLESWLQEINEREGRIEPAVKDRLSSNYIKLVELLSPEDVSEANVNARLEAQEVLADISEDVVYVIEGKVAARR